MINSLSQYPWNKLQLQVLPFKFIRNFITVVTCPALNLSSGGITYHSSPVNGRYPVDTVASFTCNYGYNYSGKGSVECQTSGYWNIGIPGPSCTQGIVMYIF